MTLAGLYGQLGMSRKAAFYNRIAAMQVRHESLMMRAFKTMKYLLISRAADRLKKSFAINRAINFINRS